MSDTEKPRHEPDGDGYRVYVNQGRNEWIKVVPRDGGFDLVGDNLTGHEDTALGFSDWDTKVEDVDNDQSDASQCFGISLELRYKGALLTPESFDARDIEGLAEALSHVTLCAWNPDDI